MGDYSNIKAGKGVKDDGEAQQIVAKYTREVRRVRQHFHTKVSDPGQAGHEGKYATPTNEDWLRNGPAKTVEKTENGKIYINGPEERLRLYDPKNVSDKPNDTGRYDVLKDS